MVVDYYALLMYISAYLYNENVFSYSAVFDSYPCTCTLSVVHVHDPIFATTFKAGSEYVAMCVVTLDI